MQLKDLIKNSEKTQKEIAKELHIAESTVSMWVSGKALPSILKAARLAKLLNIGTLEVLDAIQSTNKKRVVAPSTKPNNNSTN